MSSQSRMQELVAILTDASKAYYQEDREVMSNFEYDELYDELVALEAQSGIILANSPTQAVGYEVATELPKEAHEKAMLSLDKTKEREVLKAFVGTNETLLSWKLDGLTVVLQYSKGKLIKAVTRGNGVIGEVVTQNAKAFSNIPLQIPFKDDLTLRGEAVITYADFAKINSEISDVDAQYKNPRNLCSGSVRQLNSEITAKRHVRFYAFSLVSATGKEFENSHEKQMQWLGSQGFEIVEYCKVTANTLDTALDYFAENVAKSNLPSDGLVAIYDDIAYGDSLGTTAKFPRNAIAFKWEDETADTKLIEIEWSPSRTGLINPVAIFEPVELEGTTVSRASVHNISIMKALKLGIGDVIRVYKANMIIPQIAENLTGSGNIEIPERCPACGGMTKIQQTSDVQSLYCTNSECPAKAIKSFTLFVSRDALNIEGLSEATLEKFIAKGFIRDFGDIFEIEKYKNEIVKMEGFGEKSYDNMVKSIEKARNTTLPRLIYALGIENIGVANAKMICKAYHFDFAEIMNVEPEKLQEVDGIGEVIAQTFTEYFADDKNKSKIKHLLKHIKIEAATESGEEQIFEGMNFVVTGSVEHFSNRSEIKEVIENKGGKVTGSVTSNTNYLINNDVTSNSSKNKKAKELEVAIISEEDFIKLAKI